MKSHQETTEEASTAIARVDDRENQWCPKQPRHVYATTARQNGLFLDDRRSKHGGFPQHIYIYIYVHIV